MKILTFAFFAFFSFKTITADDVINPEEWDNIDLIYDMNNYSGVYTEKGNGRDGDCPNPIYVNVSSYLSVEVETEEDFYPFVWIRRGNDLCIRLDDDAEDFPLPWSKFCPIDRIAIVYDDNEEEQGAYSECSDD